MSQYPHERQVEYWCSRAIEDYFSNEGYDVAVIPNSPRAEKQIPYDHLFAGKGIKVFGIQYKRLYKGATDYWHIDTQQYRQLAKFDWIYYGLPQIKSIQQRRNALYLLAICEAETIRTKMSNSTASYENLHVNELGRLDNKPPYYRWGAFVQQILSCRLGWKPNSEQELRSVLAENDLVRTLVDLYIVPFEKGPLVQISPFITGIDELSEGTFDFGLADQE